MMFRLTSLQVKKLADLTFDLAKGWLLASLAVPVFSPLGINVGLVTFMMGFASLLVSLELYKVTERLK